MGVFREDRAAVKVYPAYTDSYVALIGKAENAEEMEKIDDKPELDLPDEYRKIIDSLG